jgi:hypothetical protein
MYGKGKGGGNGTILKAVGLEGVAPLLFLQKGAQYIFRRNSLR